MKHLRRFLLFAAIAPILLVAVFFGWLEKAYAGREWGIMFIKFADFPESFRKDPRFKDLLHRMNFPK